tara:strand:- start:92 stop:229 length:138 start_codon:yes stop_codon:yes gene_type:complete
MPKLLLKRKCRICKKEWVIEKPYVCTKCQKRMKKNREEAEKENDS